MYKYYNWYKFISTLFPPKLLLVAISKYVLISSYALGTVQSGYISLTEEELCCGQKYFRQAHQRLTSLLDIEINMLDSNQGDYNVTCFLITSYVPGTDLGNKAMPVNRIKAPALWGHFKEINI